MREMANLEPHVSAAVSAANPRSALLDVFKKVPLEPVMGEGVWITAADGKRYLDFYGGHAVALLGNGHPRLVAALEKQAKELFFQSNLVELAVRERAARALVGFGPAELTQVFFVNSGAEANENALRIAFLATQRPRVICLEGSFHGRTAGTAAVTAHHERWYGFPRAPYETTVVPFDDLGALERALAGDVAAVIFEPVQGVGGARALSRSFVERARALTRAQGALLIFDEVQCGMGRSGFPFAAQAYGVTPDILTTAKGIAGGFPAAAVLVGDALAAKLKKGDLGTTFGGGPLACALIEAVVAAIEEERLLPQVRRLSDRLRNECRVGPVVDVQGMGFLLGLRTTRPAQQILAELRGKQILAGDSSDPHVVRLLPPLILKDEHVDRLVAVLKELPE
jgi:acetylornithine/succinyldiaminopimelate/putrescine aminotransferase